MREPLRRLRCAIYTRKSSEEGLEQDFNSLHAQREACEAYIVSQKQEGWKALPTLYDDGGFSGGSLERPALQALLAAIRARLIDVVVVYKVDRLTRSLTDFARIVEVFDGHGVSFVSVTQAFNTTSSMGRLTLNVLLSFAQFEREVTGERIRDKIAASKKKGLWMGGFVPVGYAAKERTLAIVEADAAIIRMIFERYLDLRSVQPLADELAQAGITTRAFVAASKRRWGDRPFSRGHLYKILSNPIYAGDIAHKGTRYPGQHPAIIDRDTFAAVQAQLAANTRERAIRPGAKEPSLLAGLLIDEHGVKLTATHTTKQGQRYRYYVRPDADAPITRGRPASSSPCWRIAAKEIEAAVCQSLVESLRSGAAWQGLTRTNLPIGQRRSLGEAAARLAETLQHQSTSERRAIVLAIIRTVRIAPDRLTLQLATHGLATTLGLAMAGSSAETARPLFDRLTYQPSSPNEAAGPLDDSRCAITIPIALRRRGPETRLVIARPGGMQPPAEPDPVLVKAVAQAHRWWQAIEAGSHPTVRALALSCGKDERYIAQRLPLAFLSPRIVEAILEGNQPIELTAQALVHGTSLPLSWTEQKRLLGFAS